VGYRAAQEGSEARFRNDRVNAGFIYTTEQKITLRNTLRGRSAALPSLEASVRWDINFLPRGFETYGALITLNASPCVPLVISASKGSNQTEARGIPMGNLIRVITLSRESSTPCCVL